MAYCSECTYLNLESCDLYGKFWCEKRLERHSADEKECNRFCKAYSRDQSVSNSAYKYSIEHSSSPGCYLTTVMCNILKIPDKNYYLNTMRNFRNNILQKNIKYKEMLVEYDIVGPKIAKYIKNDPIKYDISSSILFRYIKPICLMINENKNEKAIEKYKEMTNKLKIIYNISNDSLNNVLIENANILESGHGIYKQKKITLV